MNKHSSTYCLFKCPAFPLCPSSFSSCFRYLFLCMARHAGSSTARDYCQCNWLFQAWFDTSLLSDPHTSLLSSVMERRRGSHETFSSSYLQRNRLLHFRFNALGQGRKQHPCDDEGLAAYTHTQTQADTYRHHTYTVYHRWNKYARPSHSVLIPM